MFVSLLTILPASSGELDAVVAGEGAEEGGGGAGGETS